MMYDSFRTDESMARCYTIHDLCSVKWLGEGQLEALRNTWEDKLANQREPQSDDQLATILFEILKQSKCLRTTSSDDGDDPESTGRKHISSWCGLWTDKST